MRRWRCSNVLQIAVLAAGCGRVNFDAGALRADAQPFDGRIVVDGASDGGRVPGDGGRSPPDGGRSPGDAAAPDASSGPCTPPSGLITGWTMAQPWSNQLSGIGANPLTMRCTTGCPTHARAPDRMTLDGTQWMETAPVVLGLSERFTVASWVRTTGSSQDQEVFQKRFGGSANTFELMIEPGGVPATWLWQNDAAAFSITRGREAVVAGRWTHLAVTYDANRVELYVDGRSVATGATSGPLGEDEGPLYIGVDYDEPSYQLFFFGDLTDVLLFDRPLTAAEIGALADPACLAE